jgi:hypothetical protein
MARNRNRSVKLRSQERNLRRDTWRGKRRKKGNAATHPSNVPRGPGCQRSRRFLLKRIARLKVSVTDPPRGTRPGTDLYMPLPRSQLTASQLLRQDLIEFLVGEELLFIDLECLLRSVEYPTIGPRCALINVF